MLAEKRSLYRFLIIYTTSTFSLLLIGGYLYFKLSYKNIVDRASWEMREDIYYFMKLNHEKHFILTGKKPYFENLKIAIFINSKYITGTFTPKSPKLDKIYWLQDRILFYNYTTHKRWGKVNLITFKDLSSDIRDLEIKIFVFLIFATLFILFVAFILGEIFLKPIKDSLKSLEEFIADATHEINTPISNILINIEMLQEFYPEIRESDELKRVTSSAFRVSKIFNDLSFLKLNNHLHRKELSPQKIDIILKERIEFFRSMIDNKNLELELNIESVTLEMDKEDLIRLIDNLLSNGVKYTPINRKMVINLNRKYLEIINDGSLKEPKKMFDKFTRESKSEGGFGIGLYIVKKISEQYNFSYYIYSRDRKVLVYLFSFKLIFGLNKPDIIGIFY